MKHLGIIILIGFITLAVFGAFAIHKDMNGHKVGCIASVAQGVDCPPEVGVLGYVIFHLDAFSVFSTAVFQNISILSLFLFCFLFLSTAVFFYSGATFFLKIPRRISAFLKKRILFKNILKDKFNYWLSLFENSPSLFI